MNKFTALAASALMVAATLGAAAPASAAMGPMRGHGHANPAQEQAMVMKWCRSHPRDSSCSDFNRHHHRWSDAQYRNFYQSHRHERGFDPAAAAVFGFGAILGGAMAAHSNH